MRCLLRSEMPFEQLFVLWRRELHHHNSVTPFQQTEFNTDQPVFRSICHNRRNVPMRLDPFALAFCVFCVFGLFTGCDANTMRPLPADVSTPVPFPVNRCCGDDLASFSLLFLTPPPILLHHPITSRCNGRNTRLHVLLLNHISNDSFSTQLPVIERLSRYA